MKKERQEGANLKAGNEGRDGEQGLQAVCLAACMPQQGRLRFCARRRLCMQVLEQRAEQHKVLRLLVAHLPKMRHPLNEVH